MRRHPSARHLVVLLAAALLVATGPAGGQAGVGQSGDAIDRLMPPSLADTDWIQARRKAQIQSADAIGVFHDFQFTNVVQESGIDFEHHVVLDAGKAYKPVHYDHGNGVAAADVDGDGRLDLYFTTQVGPNGLYRNLGGDRFENITRAAGVGLPDTISVTASFADIDNDGDADLYVTTVREGNRLFVNDGHGRFRDASKASGLDHVGHSSAAVFFDYDRDGLLDLFLANVGQYTGERVEADGYDYFLGFQDAFSGHLFSERQEPNLLFHNDGGHHFTDVSAAMGLTGTPWTGDASPVDANEDGWPDLYVLNMQGDDWYYQNVDGKRFEVRSRDLFPRTSWGAMGIKSFDMDNDGRMDIFITDMHSDMSHDIGPEHEKEKSDMQWPVEFRGDGSTSIWGNSFFRKTGPDEYEEVSDAIGAENYWPWGLSVGDLNADGYQDAFITASMNYPFRYGSNSLLLNDHGRHFADAEFVLGVEPRVPIVKPWFTLDADGADKDHPDAAGLSGKVNVWAARGSRSSVIFDLDDDGDLDIVTGEFNDVPMVFVSDLAERRDVRWLKVALTGTASNRDGLGARVTVTAGDRHWTQVNDGVSGYLSHSLMPLYFGLDDAREIDRVDITWPSGRQQVVAAPIAVDSTLAVTEPDGA